MVAAFSWVDVSEDCNALLLLNASLEDSSDTALDEFSVDDWCMLRLGVGLVLPLFRQPADLGLLGS